MSFTNDKFLHFAFSFFLVTTFSYVFPLYLAVLISFGIGVLKEIYDYYSPHHVADIKDILANLLGIAVGFVFMIIVL